MSDIGNAGGAVAGVIAILIALKPYILPSRQDANGNGHKSGNISPELWRVWIREECKSAIQETIAPIVREVHNRADEDGRILQAFHNAQREVNERHTALLRDIRDRKHP